MLGPEPSHQLPSIVPAENLRQAQLGLAFLTVAQTRAMVSLVARVPSIRPVYAPRSVVDVTASHGEMSLVLELIR